MRNIKLTIAYDGSKYVGWQVQKNGLAVQAVVEKAILTAASETMVLRARDGLEAMAMLRQQAPYENSPRPTLVLLDLNMPKMNGYEVLQAIRSEPELERIPVVVLSTTDDERDIAKSYALRANSYVTKPAHLREFREVVNAIGNFWLNIAKT